MELVSDLVDNVRTIIQDREGGLWDDDELLRAADLVLGPIWTTIKLSGQDHNLDREEFVIPAAGTGGILSVSELALPAYVGSVRHIEAIRSAGDDRSIPVPLAELDASLDPSRARLSYSFSRDMGPGRIMLFGVNSSSYPRIRIWFLRIPPALHRGTAQGGATTSEIRLDSTSTREGGLDAFEGAYNRSAIQIIVDTANPANVGQHRVISAWDGVTATLESPLPAIPTAGVTVYDMVLPLDREFLLYFEWKVAEELVARSWNQHAQLAVARRLGMLSDRFKSSIRERVSRAPKYIHRNKSI